LGGESGARFSDGRNERKGGERSLLRNFSEKKKGRRRYQKKKKAEPVSAHDKGRKRRRFVL